MTNKAKVIAAISGLAPETYRTKAEIAQATGLREKQVQAVLNRICKEFPLRFKRSLDFAGTHKHGYRFVTSAWEKPAAQPQADTPRMPAKRTPPQFQPYTFTQAPIRADAEAHKACPSLRDRVRVPYCPPKPMLVGKHSEIAWMPGRLG